MTGFATLTSKNQLTLPAGMVRLLDWTAGTDFWVREEDKKVILERISTLDELRKELSNNPYVQKINAKYSTVEIVKMARQMKPSKKVYDY